MIISTQRKDLKDFKFELDRYHLAPLSLGEAVQVTALLERERSDRRFVELVLSTIPEKHWIDLWCLEIETIDAPGNALRIVDLLHSLELDVLSSESSVEAFGEWNTSSFIFSARDYANPFDKTVTERFANQYAKLNFVESAIKVSLLDQLKFDDKGAPRCKIRRMNVHRRLFRDGILMEKTFLPLPETSVFEEGSFSLPEIGRELLRGLWQNEKLCYSPAVDTKNRLVRILIFPKNEEGLYHLQFGLPYGSTSEVVTVLNAVKSLGFNIVRHQIRFASQKFVEKLNVEDGRTLACMDVTFEPGASDAPMDMDEIRKLLASVIAKIQTGLPLKDRNPESWIQIVAAQKEMNLQ